MKDDLRTLIEISLKNLDIIYSCKEYLKGYTVISYIPSIIHWLTELKKDLESGIIPEFQIEKSIKTIKGSKLNTFNNTAESIRDFYQTHPDSTSLCIPDLNGLKNCLYAHRVLRAIGFAYRNAVIVGPNGCGKTTLANCFTSSIRESTGIVIPAQKLLFIPNIEGIPSTSEVNSTYEQYQQTPRNTKTTYNYKNGGDFPYELCKRFGDEMQNVILKFAADIQEVKTRAFHAMREGKQASSRTKADLAIEIWNNLMEERNLVLNDADHFAVKYKNITYAAHNMSEGERNVLYLIGRVLFAPANGYVIVDEPELYLHKTIVNKLWDRLEHERNDCKFIYLTHDLDFAVSRNAEKSWIKRFEYPNNWEIEPIIGSEIPEDLLMRILGSRKKILFCEGTKDSFDVRFFEILFSEYTIVPVSSCNDVINYTRAFNRFPGRLVDAYGIIDRDVRPEKQIEAFKQDKIYAYGVAEIENLFMAEDFIRAFAAYTHTEDLVNMESLKATVINKFRPQIDKHALDYVTASINFYYQEQRFHTAKDLSVLKTSFEDFNKAIDIDKVYSDRKSYLVSVCDSKDYPLLLKLVNNKGLVSEVGRMLGLNNYPQRALDYLFKTNSKDLLRGLFPTEL